MSTVKHLKTFPLGEIIYSLTWVLFYRFLEQFDKFNLFYLLISFEKLRIINLHAIIVPIINIIVVILYL